MRAVVLALVAATNAVHASPLVRRQAPADTDTRVIVPLCDADVTAGPTGTPGTFGSSCESNTECASSICCDNDGSGNGQCVLFGEFHDCTKDSACSSDYCYTVDSQCMSGYCPDGSCVSNLGAIVDLDDGLHCKVDSNCKGSCDQTTSLCIGGTPDTPPSCSSDSQCSSTTGSAVCFNGSCVPSSLDDGAACSSSRQCKSGTCSQGGYCRQDSSDGGNDTEPDEPEEESGGGDSSSGGGDSTSGGGTQSGGGSQTGGTSGSGNGSSGGGTQDDVVTTTDSSGATITADGTTETATATIVSVTGGAKTLAPTGSIVAAVLAVGVASLASLQLLV